MHSTPEWNTTGLVDASKCYAVLSRQSLRRPSGIEYVFGVCWLTTNCVQLSTEPQITYLEHKKRDRKWGDDEWRAKNCWRGKDVLRCDEFHPTKRRNIDVHPISALIYCRVTEKSANTMHMLIKTPLLSATVPTFLQRTQIYNQLLQQ